MKTYRSPKTIVLEKSRILGKGLFAKGEIVAIKVGSILTAKEYEQQPSRASEYCRQITDDFFIGPRNEEEISGNAIFINHSCEPNVGFSRPDCLCCFEGYCSGRRIDA